MEHVMLPRYPALLSAAVAIASVLAGGCASEGVKPTDELTRAHTLVDQAVKNGASQRYAAADVQRARDEVSNADRLEAQGKHNEARAYAQRAEVDADLAMARGDSGEQQRAAEEIAGANKDLALETDRNATSQ
jgi:Domain of unknown function (DUF4398)